MPLRDSLKRSYLIDVLWPKHTLHIVSGSSGTWKTTLLFSIIRDWEQGKPILGQYASFPTAWSYIAFDRDINETWDTLDSIGYAPDEKLIHSSYSDKRFPGDSSSVIKAMDLLIPKTGGLLVIDGLQFIAPARNDMGQFQAIGGFVKFLRQQAQRRNITLVGVCHNAKAKIGEEYAHPRDRIMGSAAWGATVGTILALENKTEDEKILWVCPRTAKEYKLNITRNGTVLQVVNEDERTETNLELTTKLVEVPPGTLLKRAEVLDWAIEFNLSESTAEKWLNRQCKAGKLIREGRGTYRIPHEN